MAYVFSGLKSIFKFDALPITVTCDGERIHGKFVYMMVMNGESVGGFKLNKHEEINNNKVKLLLIKKSKGPACFFNFVKLFLFGIKSIRKSKHVILKEVSKLEIENHANTPFTFDGEKAKFLKKKIKVKRIENIVKY